MSLVSLRNHLFLVWLVPVMVISSGCSVDWAYPENQSAARSADRAERRMQHARQTSAVDISIVEPREVDLVEEVLAARQAYHSSLAKLNEYYGEQGDATKASWSSFELAGLRRVRAFRYVMDAEVPSSQLAATESIAEADQLYNKGLDLMRKGGHGVPAVFRKDVMIDAARTFRDLIERYPSSDKIDDAAFMLGEIHKEYLKGEETIAVKWYERAWTWNPQTTHTPRFQAAVVYDYRLHDRDQALELYRAVLDSETQNDSNVRFATRRIAALTKDVSKVSSRSSE